MPVLVWSTKNFPQMWSLVTMPSSEAPTIWYVEGQPHVSVSLVFLIEFDQLPFDHHDHLWACPNLQETQIGVSLQHFESHFGSLPAFANFIIFALVSDDVWLCKWGTDFLPIGFNINRNVGKVNLVHYHQLWRRSCSPDVRTITCKLLWSVHFSHMYFPAEMLPALSV